MLSCYTWVISWLFLQLPQPRRKSDVSDLLLGTFKLRTEKSPAGCDLRQVLMFENLKKYCTATTVSVYIVQFILRGFDTTRMCKKCGRRIPVLS